MRTGPGVPANSDGHEILLARPRRLNDEFRLTARQITLPRPDEDVPVDLWMLRAKDLELWSQPVRGELRSHRNAHPPRDHAAAFASDVASGWGRVEGLHNIEFDETLRICSSAVSRTTPSRMHTN